MLGIEIFNVSKIVSFIAIFPLVSETKNFVEISFWNWTYVPWIKINAFEFALLIAALAVEIFKIIKEQF